MEKPNTIEIKINMHMFSLCNRIYELNIKHKMPIYLYISNYLCKYITVYL